MKRNLKFILMLMLGLLPNVVFGAGISSVNTLMSSIETALHAVAAVTITIAVMWVGYKVMYNKQALSEFWYVLLGALLVAGAAEIAAMML